ncbi:MAG: DUF4254 domain-containing protein [Candidatus Omnitrophota bacterium]
MAETLGSLVDKLTIKNIREFYLRRMLFDKKRKFSEKEMKDKLAILSAQKKCLKDEIDSFMVTAYMSKSVLKDEKLKLYNAREDMGRIPKTKRIGEAISLLAQKNLELWNLEDEARRRDVDLSHVGSTKRKIDLANQQRNDLIDKIDELFGRVIKGNGGKK